MWINGLTFFFANVSAGLDLDLKALFGLTHVFPCFCWAGARFGLSHFFNVSGARLGLDQAQFWAKPFYQCVFAWPWAVATAVFRTCVADEALGRLMSPR